MRPVRRDLPPIQQTGCPEQEGAGAHGRETVGAVGDGSYPADQNGIGRRRVNASPSRKQDGIEGPKSQSCIASHRPMSVTRAAFRTAAILASAQALFMSSSIVTTTVASLAASGLLDSPCSAMVTRSASPVW